MNNIERERLTIGLATLKELRLKHPQSICIISAIYAIEEKLRLKHTVKRID